MALVEESDDLVDVSFMSQDVLRGKGWVHLLAWLESGNLWADSDDITSPIRSSNDWEILWERILSLIVC